MKSAVSSVVAIEPINRHNALAFMWLALSAALPLHWSNLRIYFAIVIIVALIRWGGLVRVVRGKLLELRERDFTLAARLAGIRELTIIRRHLLPNFASYLIVDLTLAIPGMTLGETALSFLGLGLRAPSVSWGVLLAEGDEHQQRRQLPVAARPRAVRGGHRDGIQLPRRRFARRRRSPPYGGSPNAALPIRSRGAGARRSACVLVAAL